MILPRSASGGYPFAEVPGSIGRYRDECTGAPSVLGRARIESCGSMGLHPGMAGPASLCIVEFLRISGGYGERVTSCARNSPRADAPPHDAGASVATLIAAGGEGAPRIADRDAVEENCSHDPSAADDKEDSGMVNDLAALLPSVVVAAAFVAGVIAIVRHEMAPRKRSGRTHGPRGR